MNKPMRTWMVPVSTFALALVLAMVAGPKPALLARKFADPTAPIVCMSDLTNYYSLGKLAAGVYTAEGEFNILAGVPGEDTNTNLLYTGVLLHEIIVRFRGVPTTIPVPAPMPGKPPGANRAANGIVGTNEKNKHEVTQATVDAAMRTARTLAGGTYVGEAPNTRTFPELRLQINSTTSSLSGKRCTDKIVNRFVVVCVPPNGLGSGSQQN